MGGVAFIVETLTDNRNRTAGNLRHYFDKYGGNLGTSGCVSFMFSPKGVLVIDKNDLDEDTVMEKSLEYGASDFSSEGEYFVVTTEKEDYSAVFGALSKDGYTFVSADVEMVPENYIEIKDDEQLSKLQTFINIMEEDDDVQNVWHNCENLD